MFRAMVDYATATARFPRVCGDVPSFTGPASSLKVFSPRVRGCSDYDVEAIAEEAVFPACAGMFLIGCNAIGHSPGFPRVCGDVPSAWIWASEASMFSPRVRGCSVFSYRRTIGS